MKRKRTTLKKQSNINAGLILKTGCLDSRFLCHKVSTSPRFDGFEYPKQIDDTCRHYE